MDNQDKLVFVMPKSLEEILFASTVMAQYLISRMVMGRWVKDVVVVCKWEELHDYLRACWGWARVVVEPTREQIESASLVFEFSSEGSYKMTQAVEKHIAEAFAIQLGVGLMRFLPPVLVEDVKEESGLVLIADRNWMDGTDGLWRWPWQEAFHTQLVENGIPVAFISEHASWEQIRRAVGKASVVVGVRSSVTLVASAANRLVMELSPEEEGHKNWFKKKECGSFRMIYGKLEDMTDLFVWEQIAKLMDELKRPRKGKLAEVLS